MPFELNNISGKKFGRLTTTEKCRSKKCKNGTRIDWYCVCDCGKHKFVSAYSLTSGHTKSCGCLSRDTKKLPYGIATLRQTYKHYIRNATNRNYKFELTIQQFKSIVKMNCFYCGRCNTSKTKSRSDNGDFLYTGIDRLKNTVGYTIDNCVPCCVHCNRFKGDRAEDEMLKHIEDIINWRFSHGRA